MSSKNVVVLIMVMLILVVSIALMLAAILTDYWFLVKTKGIVSDRTIKENTYNFGFWRRCYDSVPENIPSENLSGSKHDCVVTYKDLLQKSNANISSSEQLVIHLSRSYIGLTIASTAAQLATAIILICGSWPGDCKRIQEHNLFICSSIVLLLSTMAGVAGGVCFIAAREVEDKELLKYSGLITKYGWSFMLEWISSGLCLVNGFLILCLIKFTYQKVKNQDNYFYGS